MTTGKPSRSLDWRMFNDGVKARLFANRTIIDSGCWIWTGLRNDAGYGVIRISGRIGWLERVHRASYAIFAGDVGVGLRVLHRCDEPACFNPDHLFLGTAQDNTNDMFTKGRNVTPRARIGELNSKAKLSHTDVLSVIERLIAGETRTKIASDFGVTIGAISRIAVGKNWKHLTVGRGIVKSTRGVRRNHV